MVADAHSPKIRASRMEPLSDGVFAVAITLLVLDIAVPESAGGHLLDALGHRWPTYLAYVVSFASVGGAWLAHDLISSCLKGVTSTFLRLNLLLLMMVSFLPFPTRVVAEFIDEAGAERVAVTFYGVCLLLVMVLIWLLWKYAVSADLIRPEMEDTERAEISRRVTPSIGFYVAMILLGLFLPVVAVFGYLAIALFLVVPLHLLRYAMPSR